MNAVPPALELAGVTKSYGATVGLDGASFHVRAGAIHALLGENGAGKSTVVKLLSGLLRQDAGEIFVEGIAAPIPDPRGAHLLGIQTAFQEISLLPNLSVCQNLLLPYEPISSVGLLRSREARRRADAILVRLGLDSIDVEAEVGSLDLPERQKIEIARAVSREPRLLLLDEPTSALSARDVEWLFDLMRRLSAAGTTILFISHRMPEVREICDSSDGLTQRPRCRHLPNKRHIRRRDYSAGHWSHACAGVSAEIGSRSTAGKAGTSHASPEESCNERAPTGRFA